MICSPGTDTQETKWASGHFCRSHTVSPCQNPQSRAESRDNQGGAAPGRYKAGQQRLYDLLRRTIGLMAAAATKPGPGLARTTHGESQAPTIKGNGCLKLTNRAVTEHRT